MSATTQEENATRTKKRHRAESESDEEQEREAAFGGQGGSAALPGGSAASAPPPSIIEPSPKLKAALGDRLSSMTGVLASQPAELIDYIISSSKEMLDLAITIRQRTEALNKHEKPMVDPTTNKPLLDANGEPLPYIPNFLKMKNPLKISAAYKDDTELKAELEAAAESWNIAVLHLVTHHKSIAQLEIKAREKTLRGKFFGLLFTIALGHIVESQIRKPNHGCTLDRKLLAQTLARGIVRSLPPSFNSALAVATRNDLLTAYDEDQDYNVSTTKELIKEEDTAFIKPLITPIVRLIGPCTTELWELIAQKDQEKKISAELKKALKPKAMAEATADVETHLDDDAARHKAKLDLVRKEAQKEAKKFMQTATRTMRKKYSGGVAVETSKPTKNGRKNGRSSSNKNETSKNQQRSSTRTESSPPPKPKTHKQKGKGKKQQQQQQNKQGDKDKRVRFATGSDRSNNNSQSAEPRSRGKRGDRGGSNGGSKQKSALRR